MGRWLTKDPLAEKYYEISSYSYCNNNPVALIDPDGRDWYQSVGGEIMWRKSISDQYVDDYSQIWKNIGETYTHLREDGSSTFFYQKTNDAGELSLASHAFSANEMAGFGLFHSDNAREAGMLNHVNPTLGTFVNMVAQEMLAQWTDPYLLTAGAAIGIAKVNSFKTYNLRLDIVLSGGRSGQLVKNLIGPPNSVLKGGGERIFITNSQGKVVWDITRDRAKPVIPGVGFGNKGVPTKQQLTLLNQILKK